MKYLTPEQLDALTQDPAPMVQFVRMETSPPLYLNTSGWTIPHDGHDWYGTAGLGEIEEISDSPGEIKGLRFSLSGLPEDRLALVLTEDVQRKPVTVYTAILKATPEGLTVSIFDVEWAGYLDTLSIEESGGSRVISVTAEHVGIDLLRARAVRYSDAEQQRLHPGDPGLEYLIDGAEKTIVWPAKEFNYK